MHNQNYIAINFELMQIGRHLPVMEQITYLNDNLRSFR